MELGLEGRVAIIAAASKGLGKAVAHSLSREGARIAICARGAETLARAAQEIHRSCGGEVFHQAVDVTQPEAISRFVAAVEERFGRVDICVTNSGGPPSKPFRETTASEWKGAAEQLLFSTVHLCREVLPRMQKNGWGRLITITSSAVRQPVDGLLLSNSLRSAVAGLAKTLATEYAPFGITVNNVCPGYTRTDRLDELARTISERSGIQQDEVFAKWEKQIPAARLGTAEEFAAAVTFLASEPAAYINGVSLAVDGGLVRSLL